MILQSGYDCYLTQSADVPMSERRFENQVLVQTAEDVSLWREITLREKEQMLAKAAFIDVEAIDVASLDRVDALVADIKANINNSELTAEEAIEKKDYYPRWEELISVPAEEREPLAVGYRLNYGGTLYEVIQEHTVQEDWKPGQGTESLYKVVQVEHEGTKEDPIPWKWNMELFSGKYYTDKDVLYLCIRDSGIGLSSDLADLVDGGYVRVMEETEEPEPDPEIPPVEETEPDGTLENPFTYSPGTALEQGKYYEQYGVTYLCIQSANGLIYDLRDIPAIAQAVLNTEN